jgi:hypothetical protein
VGCRGETANELKDQGAAEDFGSLGCKRKWTKRVEGKGEMFCIFLRDQSIEFKFEFESKQIINNAPA